MTKLAALDRFCTGMKFDTQALQGETKVQFLARKQKEWALQIIKDVYRAEVNATAQAAVDAEVASLDI